MHVYAERDGGTQTEPDASLSGTLDRAPHPEVVRHGGQPGRVDTARAILLRSQTEVFGTAAQQQRMRGYGADGQDCGQGMRAGTRQASSSHQPGGEREEHRAGEAGDQRQGGERFRALAIEPRGDDGERGLVQYRGHDHADRRPDCVEPDQGKLAQAHAITSETPTHEPGTSFQSARTVTIDPSPCSGSRQIPESTTAREKAPFVSARDQPSSVSYGRQKDAEGVVEDAHEIASVTGQAHRPAPG